MHPQKFLESAQVAPVMTDDERESHLIKLSSIIADKRREAVDARKNSGIEKTWVECEEASIGIDDANRHEYSGAKWMKPTSMVGPVTSSRIDRDDAKANLFIPLTSRYVNGATSKMCEIILPIDDKAFSLKPPPEPELVKLSKDLSPFIDASGLQQMRPAQPGETPPGIDQAAQQLAQPAASQPPSTASQSQLAQANPQQQASPQPQGGNAPVPQQPQPMMPVTNADVAQKQLDAAKDAAEKSETRIYDWMVDSKYPTEARKVIEDAARCGTGVLKAPYVEVKRSKAFIKTGDIGALEINERIIPALKWVDFWNIYPDPGCGEDINDGDYIFERDYLSAKKLRELKGQKGYIGSAIDKVLEEGPQKAFIDSGNLANREEEKGKRYEVWYFYGVLSHKDMLALQAIEEGDIDSDQEDIYAIGTMVNDTMIRAVVNPLDSGSFPYKSFRWKRRPGSPWGIGIAEQMTSSQRMVNAATRAMLNNAGLSAGPQIIMDEVSIRPADGSGKLYPNKFWYRTADAVGPVQDSFHCIEIPSVVDDMQKIIDYAMKTSEESTGIPLVTQGQTGPDDPQTLGQAELNNDNAHTWLRHLAERYDDQITLPLVEDFYEWLLLDPEIDESEKGDFKIDANGSVAMVERAIQEQFLVNLWGQVENKDFGLNPYDLMQETLKSKRMDPRKIQYSQEDFQKMQSQQPPPPPEVQVEQLRGQNAIQLQQAKAQGEQQKLQTEAQIDQQAAQNGGAAPHQVAAEARITDAKIRAETEQSVQQQKNQTDLQQAQIEAQMAREDRQADIQMKLIERDMLILKMSMENKMSLQEVHAGLADRAAQEDTKRQLSTVESQLQSNESDKQRAHEVNMHALHAATQ